MHKNLTGSHIHLPFLNIFFPRFRFLEKITRKEKQREANVLCASHYDEADSSPITPANRKQPLLTDTQIPTKMTSFDETPKTRPLQSKDKNSRLGEVAGGTAAECAVVCCCCPCTLMNLLILAVYKLPAGLCKKATRKRRRKKKQQQGLLGPTESKGSRGDDELERELRSVMERGKSVHDGVDASETVDLEKEMWDRFYSTGFWRSPSQTEPPSL